ncbi:hypothetical protein LH428_07965 [Laribacter hongkongensis]|uniref:hypothetical protein n=1 Tax=Laribacter hongkongensis TaxID=168471 RepID=UPI001EFD1E9E|nr:hypothetical protein [Laribacter hongkongensis]MCG9115792.1 hypothetical protein [Laribacter hongkongensis]
MAADKRQQQQTQQPHQSASHRMPAHSMNRMTNNLSTSQISKLIKVMSGPPQRLSPVVQAEIQRGTYRDTFSIHGAAAQRIAKRDGGKAYARDVLSQWEHLHASISARKGSEGVRVYMAGKFGSARAAIGVIQAAKAACKSMAATTTANNDGRPTESIIVLEQEAGHAVLPQEPGQVFYSPRGRFQSMEEAADALYGGVGYLSETIHQTRLMLEWAYEEIGKAIWWHQEIKEEARLAGGPVSKYALEMLTMRLEIVSGIIRDASGLIPEGIRMGPLGQPHSANLQQAA